MGEDREIQGHCLCGAVKITATVNDPKIMACHCDMCRRQSGGIHLSIMTDQTKNHIEGPAKSYRSSEWAERGFCENCGSTLWYGTIHDGARYLAAGLFDNAGGATVTTEFFADQCPTGYALAGDHERLTAAQTIELFTPSEGDTQ